MAVLIQTKKAAEGAFVDRTALFDWQALEVRQALNSAPDTARLRTLAYSGQTYTPDPKEQVKVTIDGTLMFAGSVQRVVQRVNEAQAAVFEAECADWQIDIDAKLINTTFTNQTELQILTAIVGTYASPGFTLNAVDGANLVERIRFSNIPVSQAIEKLAKLFNKDWYIDSAKDIHYFSQEANVAPFSLADGNGYAIDGTLEIREDASQIKNVVTVEGGQELSTSTYTDRRTGDGSTYSFPLTYQYKNYTLTVGGVAKTVGIDGIDSFLPASGGYDALYNFQTRTLKFPTSSPPANGAAILFTGNYYFDIKTVVRDLASVAVYGERPFYVKEAAIRSRVTARQRAQAELDAYAYPLLEGAFSTYTAGLRAGQKITVASAKLGISDDFIVTELTMVLATPSRIVYSASIASARTFDLFDLLGRLLEPDTNEDTGTVQTTVNVFALAENGEASDVVRWLAKTSPPYTWTEDRYVTVATFASLTGYATISAAGSETLATLETRPVGTSPKPMRWNRFTWVSEP